MPHFVIIIDSFIIVFSSDGQQESDKRKRAGSLSASDHLFLIHLILLGPAKREGVGGAKECLAPFCPQHTSPRVVAFFPSNDSTEFVSGVDDES